MPKPSLYKPEYDVQARKLCLLGAIDKDLADFFNIRESTLALWKNANPSFKQALKEGKDFADAKVEKSLFMRANGYEAKETQTQLYRDEIKETETVKSLPPDTTACIFWLKNRRRGEWSDRKEISGKIEHTHKSVSETDAFLEGVIGTGTDSTSKKPVSH